MTPVEILRIALKNETDMMEFYQKMGVEHPIIADICQELKNEEYKHKMLIENKIAELTKY